MSGFNIEYGSAEFAIIFMAEYGIIYFLSILTSYLFIRSAGGLLLGVAVAAIVVWIRVTLPRFRYDLLIALT